MSYSSASGHAHPSHEELEMNNAEMFKEAKRILQIDEDLIMFRIALKALKGKGYTDALAITAWREWQQQAKAVWPEWMVKHLKHVCGAERARLARL